MSVAAPIERLDPASMRGQTNGQFACFEVPHAQAAIPTAADQATVIGTERQPLDAIVVTGEFAHNLPGLGLDQADDAVHSAHSQARASMVPTERR